MTLINNLILTRASRIEAHILNHFGRELECLISTDGIHNSIFWPGEFGKIEFCGDLFADISFEPDPQATVGQAIEQLKAYAETHSRMSG